MSITLDGATVAGSSQLPVRRHFSPEIYLLMINSETIPEYVESMRRTRQYVTGAIVQGALFAVSLSAVLLRVECSQL